MNKIERQLLKTASKLIFNFFETELEKHKNEIEKKREVEKFYIDVVNSGITIDVNKLKIIGIDQLQKALKNRRIDIPR